MRERKGLSTERGLPFKIDWASRIVGSKFTAFALFYFVFEDNFSSTIPGGLIFGGRFSGGFFAFSVWTTYIWRGLYMEGIIFGIYGIILVPIFERHGLTYLKNEGRAFRNIGTTFKF